MPDRTEYNERIRKGMSWVEIGKEGPGLRRACIRRQGNRISCNASSARPSTPCGGGVG